MSQNENTLQPENHTPENVEISPAVESILDATRENPELKRFIANHTSFASMIGDLMHGVHNNILYLIRKDLSPEQIAEIAKAVELKRQLHVANDNIKRAA